MRKSNFGPIFHEMHTENIRFANFNSSVFVAIQYWFGTDQFPVYKKMELNSLAHLRIQYNARTQLQYWCDYKKKTSSKL